MPQFLTTPANEAMIISPNPVIEAYKKDVDRTLIREDLRLTPAQRFQKFEAFVRFARELQQMGQAQELKEHGKLA